MNAGFALADIHGWEKHGIAQEHWDRTESDARMGLPKGSNALTPDILQSWGLPQEAEQPWPPSFGPKGRHKQYWYNTYAVNSAFVHFPIRPISVWSRRMEQESTAFKQVVRDLHMFLCSLREDISDLEFVHYPSKLR